MPLNFQSILNKEAATQYPYLTLSPTHPTTAVPPIYGLEDPALDYQMCIMCHHCFGSKKTFDKHSPCPPGSPWVVTAAQRFIKNVSSPWFPVQRITPPPSDHSSRWAIYQSQLSMKASSIQQSYSDDFRVLHQFLRGERWLEQVEGYNHEDLVQLCSYSMQDTSYGGLHLHIRAFLSSVQRSMDEPFVRRSIGQRPAEDQEQARIKYHKDVNPPTIDHYSRVVAAMISLLHRVISNIDTPYTFSVPDDIAYACQDLISSMPPSYENEPEEEDYAENEAEESSESSDGNEDLPFTKMHTTNPVKSTTPGIQSKVAALLYLLYTQLPSQQFRGQFFTPIYHFLVLSATRKNSEWAAANSITQTIAAILFTGRLTFAWKTCQLVCNSNMDSTK